MNMAYVLLALAAAGIGMIGLETNDGNYILIGILMMLLLIFSKMFDKD